MPATTTISRIRKDRRRRSPGGYRPDPLYRLGRQAGDPAISRRRNLGLTGQNPGHDVGGARVLTVAAGHRDLDDQIRHDGYALGPACMKPCGLKNALEAGRQSSHTAAAPASQVSMGTIRASTVTPDP
jgi:hypothetical protein